MNYLFVKDNYLDDNIYLEILNDKSFFPELMTDSKDLAVKLNYYHDEKADCFAPYMFWDGWWRSPADTLKKRVIQKIWENNLSFSLEDILGFEYWTRTYMPGQYLDTHVDEDTFMYSSEKIFQGPVIGSVYYGIDNENGGFLELHKNSLINGEEKALEKNNIEKYISLEKDRERIAYKGNRLIILDAGHRLHNATASTEGIRQVLIVNVWHKDNPPLALALDKFYYE